jgi:sugar phosphate isomerase/epimerase
MAMTPALWTNMFARQSPPEALRTLARLGWPAAEMSCDHAALLRNNHSLIDSCARAVAETGILVPQMHLMLKANLANLDEVARAADIKAVIDDITTCAKLGISVGVIHPGGFHDVNTYDEWERMSEMRQESFGTIAEVAADKGVRIAIEHMFDAGNGVHGHRRFGGTVDDVLELCAQVDSQQLGICFDTSHGHLGGMNLAECIKRCGEKLWALHVSDNYGDVDRHYIPGNGSIEWGPVVAALREIGYNGPFVLETWNLNTGGESALSELELGAAYALDVANSILALY